MTATVQFSQSTERLIERIFAVHAKSHCDSTAFFSQCTSKLTRRVLPMKRLDTRKYDEKIVTCLFPTFKTRCAKRCAKRSATNTTEYKSAVANKITDNWIFTRLLVGGWDENNVHRRMRASKYKYFVGIYSYRATLIIGRIMWARREQMGELMRRRCATAFTTEFHNAICN